MTYLPGSESRGNASMHVQDDRRKTMPKGPEDADQQGADPLGDRLRMSEARFQRTRKMATSTSSSSPTREVSESLRTNGSPSETTPIAPVVNLASWLSSPEAASYFTSPLPPEAVREFTLTLHLTSFGRESHMHKTTASILRLLYVNGINVYQALLSDEDVTEKYRDNNGRLWSDVRYNGAVVLTENPIEVD